MPEWISAGSGPEKTLVGFILCPILLRFGWLVAYYQFSYTSMSKKKEEKIFNDSIYTFYALHLFFVVLRISWTLLYFGFRYCRLLSTSSFRPHSLCWLHRFCETLQLLVLQASVQLIIEAQTKIWKLLAYQSWRSVR
jgi:hypothetical protein